MTTISPNVVIGLFGRWKNLGWRLNGRGFLVVDRYEGRQVSLQLVQVDRPVRRYPVVKAATVLSVVVVPAEDLTGGGPRAPARRRRACRRPGGAKAGRPYPLARLAKPSADRRCHIFVRRRRRVAAGGADPLTHNLQFVVIGVVLSDLGHEWRGIRQDVNVLNLAAARYPVHDRGDVLLEASDLLGGVEGDGRGALVLPPRLCQRRTQQEGQTLRQEISIIDDIYNYIYHYLYFI